MIAAGTTGLISATAAGPARAAARGRSEGADGTPEQVHLTWGDDPTRSVVVSWASPGRADRPRVRIGQRVITATERSYTDTLSGVANWTYHARVAGLRPGATYGYAVTADNDVNAADPFSATFTTAPEGRAAFRFTSFGNLAAPSPAWAAYAVGAVETFQPLFHLLNGDVTYAGPNPGPQSLADRAQAWRDFGNNVQASAANRPWLPVPGDDEFEPGDGEPGRASYLTRYTLPSNGMGDLEGRWYAFRVGTALFVCLSGNDVAYQDADTSAGDTFAADTGPRPAEPTAGGPPVTAGTPRYVRGYSGGAQTRWLESTLAAARADPSIDWIVVQLHQCACSSAPDGDGSDLGVRREWLPLFDTYEVDLVLSGHDLGYERSFPVRGFDSDAGVDLLTGAAVDTRRPHPVTAVDSGVFDTSQGTVHLVLGCGGRFPGPASPADSASADRASADRGRVRRGSGTSPRMARVLTRPTAPEPGRRIHGGGTVSSGNTVHSGNTVSSRKGPAADAVEVATWSARRDTSTGYGIAVFDVNPGSEAGGQTSVTVRYYHAAGPDPVGSDPAGSDLASPDLVGPDPFTTATSALGAPTDDYTLFETFTLVRPRSDGRRWHLR
jgi:Purple acid Phosphatase, N-terminal domain/Calcineurin-like phosphoesterase